MAVFASRVPDTVAANMSTTMKLAKTAAEGGDGVCGQDTARVFELVRRHLRDV